MIISSKHQMKAKKLDNTGFDWKVQLIEMEEKYKETKSIYKRKVKHLTRVQESLRKLRKEVKEADERRSKQREKDRLFSSSLLGRLMIRCGIRKEAPTHDDDEDSDGGGGNPAPTKKRRLDGCSNTDGATTNNMSYGSSTSSDDDDDNGQDY